jgi:VanZ family protein
MHTARAFWALAFGWAVFIFVLSSIPGQSMPQIAMLRFDKLDHAFVYAVLGGLCLLAIRRTWVLSKARLIGLAALFAVLYGITDEFHQLFVPGRNADVYDAIADGIGGLVGATVASLIRLSQPDGRPKAERAASARPREGGSA